MRGEKGGGGETKRQRQRDEKNHRAIFRLGHSHLAQDYVPHVARGATSSGLYNMEDRHSTNVFVKEHCVPGFRSILFVNECFLQILVS